MKFFKLNKETILLVTLCGFCAFQIYLIYHPSKIKKEIMQDVIDDEVLIYADDDPFLENENKG